MPEETCCIRGCRKAVQKLSYCWSHYLYWSSSSIKPGDPMPEWMKRAIGSVSPGFRGVRSGEAE